MDPENLTLRVLKEIRDAVDQTNERLEQTRVELGQRIVESELRTATAITELAGAVGGVRDLLEQPLDLRTRVDRCEADIREIKSRL